MKYALCGILIGLSDSLIQNVKTKLNATLAGGTFKVTITGEFKQ